MNSKTVIVGIMQLCVLLLLLGRFSIQALAQVAETPWPMFGHDLRHTWRSPYKGPQTRPQIKWEFTVGKPVFIYSSLVLGEDGVVYIGGTDSSLYAINPNNGTLRWKFSLGGQVRSSPAISKDGTVYVGVTGFGASLYAINPNGTPKWKLRHPNMGSLASPAIGNDGTIYVGAGTEFYAINPDGTVKWEYPNHDVIRSAPAIAKDSTIYYCSEDEGRALTAVNPDRSLKWARAISGWGVTSAPTIAEDGTIYVGSTDRRLHALDSNGNTKWTFTTDDEIHSSPALGPDGTVYVSNRSGRLYAIDPQGQQKWMALGRGTGSFGYGVIIGADSIIYGGTAWALSPNGKEKWYWGDGNSSTAVIGRDGTLYGNSLAGHSVLALASETVSVKEISGNQPESYWLSQNYPNPFNPSTTIRYAIVKSSNVTLKVFNNLGEEIETLVNETKPRGEYQFRWKPTNLPSGMYFYRIEAGEFVETKKLILLK